MRAFILSSAKGPAFSSLPNHMLYVQMLNGGALAERGVLVSTDETATGAVWRVVKGCAGTGAARLGTAVEFDLALEAGATSSEEFLFTRFLMGERDGDSWSLSVKSMASSLLAIMIEKRVPEVRRVLVAAVCC
jgi:hypothetical protein